MNFSTFALRKKLVFVVSAPAGTGKTTLVNKLTSEYSSIVRLISCTTRVPRARETQGKDYLFLSKDDFEKKIQNEEFIEYAQVFGHYYGILKQSFKEAQSRDNHIILVIDTQGMIRLKQAVPNLISIFIVPPSLYELEARLQTRNSENSLKIAERIDWALKELELIPNYDYQILNEDFQTAYIALRSIIVAEEHKIPHI